MTLHNTMTLHNNSAHAHKSYNSRPSKAYRLENALNYEMSSSVSFQVTFFFIERVTGPLLGFP